jgi:hypothetical protein
MVVLGPEYGANHGSRPCRIKILTISYSILPPEFRYLANSLSNVMGPRLQIVSNSLSPRGRLSSIELIACKNTNINIVNPDQIGTIVMDECKNIELLGEGNFDMWNVISIGSSDICLILNGERHKVPSSIGIEEKFRLKSYKKGNEYISETCDNYGSTTPV